MFFLTVIFVPRSETAALGVGMGDGTFLLWNPYFPDGSEGENIQSLKRNSFIATRKRILSIQNSFPVFGPETQFQICYRRGIADHGENDLERERQELNLLPAHRVRGRYKEVEVQAPFHLNLSDNSTYCRLSVHARTVWAWPHVTNH